VVVSIVLGGLLAVLLLERVSFGREPSGHMASTVE
jgi:hypothetical protein